MIEKLVYNILMSTAFMIFLFISLKNSERFKANVQFRVYCLKDHLETKYLFKGISVY